MNKFKIYMVNGDNSYASWFPFPYEITKDISRAQIIWWEGGADVNPAEYGEKVGSYTGVDYSSSLLERKAWDYSKNKPIFKIGTCKGSQNLITFNGGKMVQHSGHPFYHDVITNDGLTLNAISTHHQQGLVDEKITGLKEGKDYELIAWTNKLSKFHLNGNNVDYEFPDTYREPEITWFPKSFSWAVQSHPENMEIDSPFVKYCQKKLVEKMKESGLFKI